MVVGAMNMKKALITGMMFVAMSICCMVTTAHAHKSSVKAFIAEASRIEGEAYAQGIRDYYDGQCRRTGPTSEEDPGGRWRWGYDAAMKRDHGRHYAGDDVCFPGRGGH
jgi:YD repeat-containing protein